MLYGKIVDGNLQNAPYSIVVEDYRIYNPLPDQLLADGYLPVVETEPPVIEDGYYAAPHWTEQDGKIVQSWTVNVAELSADEALDIILGGGEA